MNCDAERLSELLHADADIVESLIDKDSRVTADVVRLEIATWSRRIADLLLVVRKPRPRRAGGKAGRK